jgi:MFS family permease
VKRHGAKLPLVIGPSIAALGFLMFMLPGIGGSYWTTFFPAVVVLGLGMALSVAPLTTTVMNAVPKNRAGIASGVNNAVSRVGGLLGIAVLGIVIVQAFNRELDHRLARPDISPEVRRSIDEQRVRLAGARLPPGVNNQTRIALTQAINESFVIGFRIVMMTAVGLALASVLWALILIGDRPMDSRVLRKSRYGVNQ